MQNYKLIEQKFLENEQSNALVYEHNITKAKIFVMENEDLNKTFGIGFRTPPTDNTGVCHILEHCVLNGSKKYKTKEPFMDMVKGSLSTFLNAMTFPDKTIYPVASRNDQDFKNLTDVYLDAVFNPRVLEDEKIFNQEGWRYSLEGNKLEYKGVVYNEMKGAMSGFERQVYTQVLEELFPDSIYGLNSGGDPYKIPELKYNDFIKYYKDYYHPSNSYIFLYGNMDHKAYLQYIHEDFLSKYTFRKVDSELKYQPKINEVREREVFINTSKKASDDNSYLSYSVILGDATDSKNRIIANILNSALINNESSTLRQKLLLSGILDVIISGGSTNLEAVFSIIAKNINPKNKKKFIEIIEEELNLIVEKGIDTDLIQTELNSYKFDIREKGNNANKGVEYFINAFDSWLYDKSPIEGIDIFEDIEYVENNLSNGIFEKFIKENILDNNHKVIISHRPKENLNKEKDEKVKEMLQKKLYSLSETEKEVLNKKRIEMEEFQNRENTPEEKATIPMLSKSDVDANIERIDRQVITYNDYTLVKHNLPTAGIDYLRLVFDIDHISEKEDILYLSLLTYALGMFDTKNFNYSDLNKNIYLNTGGISFDISQYQNYKTKEITRKLVVSTKVFSESIKNATKTILEVIKNTLFKNESRLKELISLINADFEFSMYQTAHVLMMQRALSNVLEANKYKEYVKGIDFYLFTKSLKDVELSEILTKLKTIHKKVFNKNNLIIDVASDFTNKKDLETSIEEIAMNFDLNNLPNTKFKFTPSRKSEAFKTSADVNYVSYGNVLSETYNSKMVVLNNLVSTEFLYNEIRAKSGAYGAGMTTYENGNGFATYSYRDPNIKSTLETYKQIANFLENLSFSENDLLPYIIGAVGNFNKPLTERQKAKRDLGLYISGKPYENLEENIINALSVDIETLKSYSKKIKETISNASIAVLGSKESIETEKDLFDEIIEL